VARNASSRARRGKREGAVKGPRECGRKHSKFKGAGEGYQPGKGSWWPGLDQNRRVLRSLGGVGRLRRNEMEKEASGGGMEVSAG